MYTNEGRLSIKVTFNNNNIEERESNVVPRSGWLSYTTSLSVCLQSGATVPLPVIIPFFPIFSSLQATFGKEEELSSQPKFGDIFSPNMSPPIRGQSRGRDLIWTNERPAFGQ